MTNESFNHPPQWSGPPSPRPPKKRHPIRWTLIGVGAIVAIAIGAAAAGSGNGSKDNAAQVTATSSAPRTTAPVATAPVTHMPVAKPTTTAPTHRAAPRPTPRPTPKPVPRPTPKPAPKPAPTVVFEVSGTGQPDITYGSDSDNRSGNTHTDEYGMGFGVVPFRASLPLDNSAEYYDIDAQLQGDGDITCAVIIDGKTIATGHASGDYNICSAQAGQGLFGGWEKE